MAALWLYDAYAKDAVYFREDFNNLSAWKEVYFPKIPRHTFYGTEKSGYNSYLVSRSDDSASLLVYKKSFDVYEYTKVRWRWKVKDLYKNSDPREKSGDDYPIRIYIAFEYEPAKAGIFESALFNTMKIIYGEYPPSGSLNYVWSSGTPSGRTIPSPYTDRNRMIFLEKGTDKIGLWVDEEVDIVKDYVEIFGKKPPRHATLGIMNDSDNTHQKSTSYVDFIEVFRSEENGGR
jgi:hypothetical protein